MSVKQSLANFLKYNRVAYGVYYVCASTVFRVVGLFVPIDNRLILFNSFAGRSFGDSPKAVFDCMGRDQRFAGYRLVWAFHNPDDYTVDGAAKIKTDTLQYFLTALRARVWVTNSSVERGLSFKKRGTTYINTWHGTPLKKMGSDIAGGNQSFKSRGKNRFDAMCVQGEFEARVWARGFGVPSDALARTGLPRNDELAKDCGERRAMLREELGIPEGKRAILYCPTFREYEKDAAYGVVMRSPFDIPALESELGEDYILLVRAHYEVTKRMGIEDSDFCRDVTEYGDLNGLMLASDLLISDYSSVYFDYSITGKPMLHYTYDYDEYASKRGMYFDIRDWLGGSESQEGLVEVLKSLDYDAEAGKSRAFRAEFVQYYGDAAQSVVDLIHTLLSESS